MEKLEKKSFVGAQLAIGEKSSITIASELPFTAKKRF